MARTGQDRGDDPREYIYGIHPVEEALHTDSSRVERILVARESEGNRLGRILKEARKAGVPVSRLPREGLARKAGKQAVHQGVVAVVSPVRYQDPVEIAVRSLNEGNSLLVLLSGVEDPRNLGAVLRSAAAAGADGVILAGEKAVGVTPGAVKSSAGAVARVPVGRARKPVRAIRELETGRFYRCRHGSTGPAVMGNGGFDRSGGCGGRGRGERDRPERGPGVPPLRGATAGGGGGIP